MKRRWNKGIGAVRQKEHLGFSGEDQNEALYDCKIAQWKLQGGVCADCGDMLDGCRAIWKSAKYAKESFTAWARGHLTELDQASCEFVQTPRSPDEIHARYLDGGYFLVHKHRCGPMTDRKVHSMGIGGEGPGFVRELHDFLDENGIVDLPKDAAMLADIWRTVGERLTVKQRLLLREAQKKSAKVRKIARVGEEDDTSRRGKKKVRQIGEGPEADAALRAEQEARREEDDRLAREEQAFLASYGVVRPSAG